MTAYADHLLLVFNLIEHSDSELTAAEVAQAVGISRRSASDHLNFLLGRDVLVSARRDGSLRYRRNTERGGRAQTLTDQLQAAWLTRGLSASSHDDYTDDDEASSTLA